MAGLGALNSAFNIGTNLLNMFQGQADRQYAHALQERIFEREDSAIQRRVADARQAGLSPLAAIGGNGAGAGQVVSVPQVSGEMTGIDLAGGMSAMLNSGAGLEANEIKRLEIAQQAEQFAKTFGLEQQKFDASVKQFFEKLKHEKEIQKLQQEWQSGQNALDRQINMAIESMKDQTQKSIALQHWQLESRKINEMIREFNTTTDMQKKHFMMTFIRDTILNSLNTIANLGNAGAHIADALIPF